MFFSGSGTFSFVPGLIRRKKAEQDEGFPDFSVDDISFRGAPCGGGNGGKHEDPFGAASGTLTPISDFFGTSAHEGEEITQEAFLALFRHLVLDKPRTNLDASLIRVVHNLALKRRDQSRKSLAVLSHTGLTEDCARDPTPTAEVNLVNLQTQERLRFLIRSLPEQDQRCLALRADGAVSISLARSLARLGRTIER
jgi:RNA polymerase sigma-70 factor, ECF subfamily